MQGNVDQFNQPRVLIADDDAEVRAFLTELVSALGGVAIEVTDGLAALHAARSDTPDLILLDVEMPRMDGLTACKTLKSDDSTSRIPIIIITSLSSLEDRIHGIEAGADEFLTKPVRIPEFNARVKSLLRVKKLNESLESAETVIFALARAIEAKDKYTQGHTERVTRFALSLGKSAGCTEDELIGLRQGGILHDIGKIGVPDHILNKPGRLMPDELEIVKQHPLIGFNICSPMKSLARTLPCIRWHHEKPSGAGYPDGLKAGQIPHLALILAVADVYDALTTKRSYKEALPRTNAIEILKEEAAKGSLDSELVRIFIGEALPSALDDSRLIPGI